jgi:hypothetical protein
LESLTTAVMALPADYYKEGSYAKWSKVIWAVRNVAGAGAYEAEGRKLAHDFSKQAGAASYSADAVDRLWSRAKSSGNLIYWGSLYWELKQSGAPSELLRQLRTAVVPAQSDQAHTDWNKDHLEQSIVELIPELQRPLNFSLKNGIINFTAGGTSGAVDSRSSAVSLESRHRGHLFRDLPINSSLSLLHRDITDDIISVSWTLNYENETDDSATLSTNNRVPASIVWHHPMQEDSFCTVAIAGMRSGGAITQKKPLAYLQKRATSAISSFLKHEFGITANIFTNNVHIHVPGGDDRHTYEALIDMLTSTHPDLLDIVRFAGDAKNPSYNGIFLCDQDTYIWGQEHNCTIERLLRKRFKTVPGLTTDERKHIESRRGSTNLRCMFCAMVRDARFESKLNGNLDIFLVKNGAYDVREKEFRAIKPEDYVCLHADWEYDPERAKTYRPEVEDFLCKIFPVATKRNIVLRFLAALLSGRREIKKVLCLNDKRAGNNGKSTLVKFVQCFFDMLCKSSTKFVTKGSHDKDKDSHDAGFEPFVPVGARACVAEELKHIMKLDVGLLKSLSGGTGTRVEGRKCGSSETFRFTWQAGIIMVFIEGDCPQFDVGDAAWVGRMLVAPIHSRFEAGELSDESFTFPMDSNLTSHFPLWRNALLDILVEHYKTGDIAAEDVPRDMLEWRSEIVDSGNGLGEWLASVVSKTEEASDFIVLRELKSAYVMLDSHQKSVPAKDFNRVAHAWFVSQGFTFRAVSTVNGKPERGVVRGARMQLA